MVYVKQWQTKYSLLLSVGSRWLAFLKYCEALNSEILKKKTKLLEYTYFKHIKWAGIHVF